MAKRGYTAQILLLTEVAAEAAGVDSVDPVALLAALARRLPPPQRRAPGVPRYQGIVPLSPGGIRDMLRSLANRRLANRVARISLRVFGHDSAIRESYPVYCAFARRLNLPCWSPAYYRRHAFGYRPTAKPDRVILL